MINKKILLLAPAFLCVGLLASCANTTRNTLAENTGRAGDDIARNRPGTAVAFHRDYQHANSNARAVDESVAADRAYRSDRSSRLETDEAVTISSSARPARQKTEKYEADNTGKNQRDGETDNSTLLPTDQAKGSSQDVELTRRIRKMIMDSEGFSTNAQNIKIITLQGRTTLRGPVESADERAKLGSIARQVVGAKSVRNQLEVVSQ